MASALTHHRRLAFPQTAREEPSVGGRPAAREPGTGTRIKARHQGTYLASPAAPPRWVRLSAASHSHGQPGAGQLGRATDGGTSSSPCSMLHAPCSIHPRQTRSRFRGEGPTSKPAGPAGLCRGVVPGLIVRGRPQIDGGGPMGGGKGVCYRTPLCSVSAASSRGQLYGRGPAREEKDGGRRRTLHGSGSWQWSAPLVEVPRCPGCPCAHWRSSSCDRARAGTSRHGRCCKLLGAWCLAAPWRASCELGALS